MKKESKRLAWALGLVAGLGILSIVYAALSSTLYIKGRGTVDVGQVQFVEGTCKAVAIGTNDLSVNNAAGASLNGDASGAYLSGQGVIAFLPTEQGANAFGKGASDITITRNTTLRSNHDNDQLTINGTELYDYGTFVVYEVELENTSHNDMYLSKAPLIQAKFQKTGDPAGNPVVDNQVKVTVYATKDEALKQAGTTLAPYDLRNTTLPTRNANYLEKAETTTSGANKTKWYIKVQKVGQSTTNTSAALTGDEQLNSGSFSFDLNLADVVSNINSSATSDTAHVAVWESVGNGR
jgi:hypothetical protein